jgi:hypothetical protein
MERDGRNRPDRRWMDVCGQTKIGDTKSEATTLQSAHELCSDGQWQRNVEGHNVTKCPWALQWWPTTMRRRRPQCCKAPVSSATMVDGNVTSKAMVLQSACELHNDGWRQRDVEGHDVANCCTITRDVATPKIRGSAATPKTRGSTIIPRTRGGAATPKTRGGVPTHGDAIEAILFSFFFFSLAWCLLDAHLRS